MKFTKSILSVLCCFLCLNMHGQVAGSSDVGEYLNVRSFDEVFADQFHFSVFSEKSSSLLQESNLYANLADHLPGIFCKMEYKIEGKSKLAPRFRLGSLNYTEWMEGKRDIYSRYWK